MTPLRLVGAGEQEPAERRGDARARGSAFRAGQTDGAPGNVRARVCQGTRQAVLEARPCVVRRRRPHRLLPKPMAPILCQHGNLRQRGNP